mgnify:CR=1 FL=1
MGDEEIGANLEDENPLRPPDLGPLYDCRTVQIITMPYLFPCYCQWCKGEITPHARPVMFTMAMN